MTDNSPATDELIAQIEADIKNGTMGEHHVILSLIARIRAETAKNSGEVVGWHIAGTTAITKDRDVVDRWNIGNPSAIVEPVYATPANSRAEAIRECIAVVEAMKETHSGIDDVTVRLRALLDKPQPDSRAEAIGVKPLEWKAVRKAVIGADGYEITDMSAGNKQGWRGSFPGENTYRWFSTIEDAQDAAQGHYLRALLQQEGE